VGDYSATSIDPNDNSFWTVQEYATEEPGNPGSYQLGTSVTQVKVPRTVVVMKVFPTIQGLVFTASITANILAQGQIVFSNHARFQGLEAPIYDVDCRTPLSGPDFLAQGYLGLTAESLEPMLPLLHFYPTGSSADGYLLSELVEVPGGGPRFFQLRAWEAAAGSSYEAAVAAGGKHGVSNISLVQAVFPPGAPGIPSGLQSFCLVPEPSSLALLIGGGLLMTAFWF
jgi:hypothetical protein